ncbi:MAG: hypothetical protein WC325_01190 [Candidatus Bathyarchaeia archaeon]|jgi:hypothetical protein
MKKEKQFVRKEKSEEETETMDVYNEKQLEEMLENDEITEAEYSFMQGRDNKKKNLGLERSEHEDTLADELAKDEYQDD